MANHVMNAAISTPECRIFTELNNAIGGGVTSQGIDQFHRCIRSIGKTVKNLIAKIFEFV